MTELERLLSAIRPPEPSHLLDQRVQALLAEVPTTRFKTRGHDFAVLFTAATCAGIIGFWCGRQTTVAPQAYLPTINTPKIQEPKTENLVKVALGQDQLAGMFVNSSSPEHMLGRGTVQVQISTSPQE